MRIGGYIVYHLALQYIDIYHAAGYKYIRPLISKEEDFKSNQAQQPSSP